MKRLLLAFALSASALDPIAAVSQPEDCTKTLIAGSESSSSTVEQRLSAAYNMSEGQWQDKKASAGVNAVIYGVPVGATYGQFQISVASKAEEYKIDRFDKRSYAYATAGLNETNFRIYSACINGQDKGFKIIAGDISESAYTVRLINNPANNTDRSIHGKLPNSINVAPEYISKLREELAVLSAADSWDQDFVIQPQDPNKEVQISVQFGGASKALILPPLIAKPARLTLRGSAEYSLKHRVQGVPSQDCSIGTPAGGEGGHPVGFISNTEACLSFDPETLGSRFKIDLSTVRISSTSNSCGWVTCPETADDDGVKAPHRTALNASQCEKPPPATIFCFHVRMACPAAYDDTCTTRWRMDGEAVESR